MQGLTRTGEPTVLKHWQISLLWRVPTSGGPVYLKAVPDFFAREVRVTPARAAGVPGAAPPVLAADEGRGLLLLADAGTDVDAPDLPALLRHVARVQRASLPLLPALGLEDRGPAQVRSRLADLFSDEVLLVGEEGGLTPGEAGRLRALRPELEAALTRLEASPLPLTLGHGDLHGGNVVERAGEFTLLDWSDACVTHPFLDANAAYLTAHGTPTPPEDIAAAHDAYLSEWADLAPLDDLRGLHADALRAGELFRALGYVDNIQPHVEDPQEWRGAHLEHLRKVLPE
ncbi:phosphotransferase family protein [Deinococcus terrestris]|uniref:phosphotransferase family protein n=1 Tax=Deinococcus terrestris TaxID=2651870 RepID=UPI0018832A43|nr:phosphotransferase [Deinococcus terrestris]